MFDLIAAIDGWGRTAPERVAHVSGDRQLRYGELAERSDALASWLLRELPDERAPVVLVGHKEPAMLIGFLGCAKAGHPYVPLDTIMPEQRRRRVIETARAPFALDMDDVMRISADGGPLSRRRGGPRDVHYIMFTSGSTGEPKGVPITRGALTHFLAWLQSEHEFRTGAEVFLNQVVYSFDVSHMDTYLSLINGGRLVSLSRDDIGDLRRLFEAIAGARLTTWVSTPTFAQLCLTERRFGEDMLPRLRRFLFCGETLGVETAGALLDRFPDAEIWNLYGPTEATIAATSIRVDRELLDRYPAIPIGRAMPGSRVEIVDDELHPVAPGTQGEILIAGPNVSPGYLERPELNARVFVELDGVPAYRTGDRGWVEDGLLFFGGRMDRQVKLQGFRVELGDVESHLTALPGVLGAAVLPVEKDGSVQSLTAFVVLADFDRAKERARIRQLRKALLDRVPAYMLPRRFRVLDNFPMTPNGKVDRRRLSAAAAP